MSNLSDAYSSIYEGKDPSFQVKKSSGAGALSKDAAEQLGPKAVALRKKKAAAVDLPKLKKEEVDLEEAHWDPVTKKISDKKRTGSDPEIQKMAKKAAASGPKKRVPLGQGTRNKASKFKPSSREEAKADKAKWDSYWEGMHRKEETDYILDKVVGILREKSKDHEYSMARTELDIASKAIKKIQNKVKGEGNIEAWVQSKITRAADYLQAAASYMDSGEHDHVEEEYVLEAEMTSSDKAKEKSLKKKYDKSGMKQSMIDQYGKERGTQIYFAKIRKMAMEEIEQLDELAPLAAGVLAAGAAGLGAMAINRARQAAKSGVDAAKSGAKVKPSTGIAGAAYGLQKRQQAQADAMKLLRQSFDYEEVYNYIIESLVDSEFADDYESASNMFESISDAFVASIIEDYLEEKARGTRPKRTVHAYDVDETLFSHGKKGKPNVKVHVKDASGKRVKSLSNQEFNTHKLEKGHSYDFSEFQSAKKFKETSSPNKKVIKDIKRKQARGQNVHLITARSKFDKPGEFQGHLKKHGINVDKSKIHYTGGMKGGDVGEKKVKVANAVAKQSGAKKVHMYDDAAKVHKAFEKEKKNKPSMKYKTHLVKPDKKGEPTIRSYQTTKEEMSSYEYWKQFINEN